MSQEDKKITQFQPFKFMSQLNKKKKKDKSEVKLFIKEALMKEFKNGYPKSKRIMT